MVFHESCAEFRAPGRVLVIDDDPGTLDGFQSVLEASGFTVVTTLSGAEGVCQAARQHFDVVLADLRLPDCSGLDILPDMKAAGITAPILIITGYATVASAVKAIQLGAFDVAEKPLIGDELLAIVNKAITSGRRREPALFSTADDGLQPIAHAAARWARAVVQPISCLSDPRTIELWARAVATSPPTLRNWCRGAMVSPRRSLTLTRLIRAAYLRSVRDYDLNDALDADPRTISRLRSLFESAQLVDMSGTAADALHRFVNQQALVQQPLALRELHGAIRNLDPQLIPAIRDP